MAFSDNLKQIRKAKGLSQEELAELLEVSRQAVSKWELGAGYPEVEKLLLLAKKLNVSLDCLMAEEIMEPSTDIQNSEKTGRIRIASFDGKAIVNCFNIQSSQMFKTKADEPKYALFGISGYSFWGEQSTVLGWYDKEDNVKKEIQEIMEALKRGDLSYQLKYAVKVKKRGWKLKIDG